MKTLSFDLTDAYKLRYEVFCTKYNIIKDLSGEVESDIYDTSPATLHIGAVEDDELVGYVRLVASNGGLSYPGYSRMSLFERLIMRGCNSAEVSRLCAISPGAGLALFHGVTNACKTYGIEMLLAFVPTVTERLMVKAGLRFVYKGEAVDYNGPRHVLLNSWKALDAGLADYDSKKYSIGYLKY